MKPFFGKVPVIMGIVNVTPDSFSDGGLFYEPMRAVEHGLRLAEEGADILDIGGESARPDAAPVSVQQEIDRVLPVIEGLKGCGKIVSIDTRNAATMREAVKAGAGMVNDVSALRHDPDALPFVAGTGVSVCLMHMRGTPQTMQQNPYYDDVVSEVAAFLAERIEVCAQAGIAKERVVVDPGICFGKTLQHNLALLRNVKAFAALGAPVLIGVSRKSFIEKICPGTPAGARLPGSLAAALWALAQGATILRVHDVAATRQAIQVYEGISSWNNGRIMA